ncbi:MAG: hypothetical protein DHS80DRAFT_31890 [Piptocephalis tieghemiana]|nr:MAG: hypothetical protein DHS80DRAFT_31890 [Piptocephalis tieghemiana]
MSLPNSTSFLEASSFPVAHPSSLDSSSPSQLKVPSSSSSSSSSSLPPPIPSSLSSLPLGTSSGPSLPPPPTTLLSQYPSFSAGPNATYPTGLVSSLGAGPRDPPSLSSSSSSSSVTTYPPPPPCGYPDPSNTSHSQSMSFSPSSSSSSSSVVAAAATISTPTHPTSSILITRPHPPPPTSFLAQPILTPASSSSSSALPPAPPPLPGLYRPTSSSSSSKDEVMSDLSPGRKRLAFWLSTLPSSSSSSSSDDLSKGSSPTGPGHHPADGGKRRRLTLSMASSSVSAHPTYPPPPPPPPPSTASLNHPTPKTTPSSYVYGVPLTASGPRVLPAIIPTTPSTLPSSLPTPPRSGLPTPEASGQEGCQSRTCTPSIGRAKDSKSLDPHHSIHHPTRDHGERHSPSHRSSPSSRLPIPSPSLRNLQSRQLRHLPCPTYGQDVQRGRAWEGGVLRAEMVDLIYRLNHAFRNHPETAHMATSHIDRYLSHTRVPLASQRRLLASASFLLAAKFAEEDREPRVSDVVECTEALGLPLSGGVKDLQRMERRLLQGLTHDLAIVTPHAVITEALRVPHPILRSLPREVPEHASRWLDLALPQEAWLSWKPVTLAIASLALAAHHLHRPPAPILPFTFWAPLAAESPEQVEACARFLLGAARSTCARIELRRRKVLGNSPSSRRLTRKVGPKSSPSPTPAPSIAHTTGKPCPP